MPTFFRKLMLLSVAACALSAAVPPAHAADKPVPDLKFQDLSGKTHKLSSLRGSITVINFWATWCGPCKEELPRLAALQAQYASKGVRFVAISVDEPKDRSKIEPYLHSHSIALDVWSGADINTLDRLHLGNAVPATIILDKDGTPVGRIMGEAKDADITTYLDWLLSDRSSPEPPAFLKRL